MKQQKGDNIKHFSYFGGKILPNSYQFLENCQNSDDFRKSRPRYAQCQKNISLQKNVLNSLQPPKTASTGPKFCCSQKVSFLKGSFRCSPNHIQHWNMECHTPLERSRIAFYGYVNFWSPNQTIWWLGAFEGFWR